MKPLSSAYIYKDDIYYSKSTFFNALAILIFVLFNSLRAVNHSAGFLNDSLSRMQTHKYLATFFVPFLLSSYKVICDVIAGAWGNKF